MSTIRDLQQTKIALKSRLEYLCLEAEKEYNKGLDVARYLKELDKLEAEYNEVCNGLKLLDNV